MTDSASWILINQLVQIIAIIIGAFVVVKIFSRLISKINEGTLKKGTLKNIQRFIQLIVYSIAAILIMHIFEINVTGLVASLGVGALIIGFALKDIIENWVSGLLMISARVYRTGDVIRVGDLMGVVTDISLRTTKLRTYDRNEIIIPNSVLLKEKVVNLTTGKKECVVAITFYVDYIFDVDAVKKLVESVVLTSPNVIVDKKRKREIRFIVRIKEWTTEIECLFWIDDPENEEFIKSKITESINKTLKKEKILPPIPGVMRKEFLENKEKYDIN